MFTGDLRSRQSDAAGQKAGGKLDGGSDDRGQAGDAQEIDDRSGRTDHRRRRRARARWVNHDPRAIVKQRLPLDEYAQPQINPEGAEQGQHADRIESAEMSAPKAIASLR